jgi:hypothetical protein
VTDSGWSYSFAPRAAQDLDDLNTDDRQRVYAMLDRFSADAVSSGAKI